MSVQIIHGDALAELKRLPNETVQCGVTSPPYWGLRDYGHERQLGSEKTYQDYVKNMVEVVLDPFGGAAPLPKSLWSSDDAPS